MSSSPLTPSACLNPLSPATVGLLSEIPPRTWTPPAAPRPAPTRRRLEPPSPVGGRSLGPAEKLLVDPRVEGVDHREPAGLLALPVHGDARVGDVGAVRE